MAHALRHAHGMDLAMRGVPLSVSQQLLGHDDARTTSIYTAAHAEDLSAALADPGALRELAAQRLPLACGASPLVGRSSQPTLMTTNETLVVIGAGGID
jgi:hypothetical protein